MRLPEREVRVVVEEAPPPVEEETNLLRTVSDAAWRLLVIGVVVALILWGAIYIRVVVIPIILAVFMTALLMPPTLWLRRRGMGRGLSTALIVLSAFVIFGGVVTLIVMPAVSGFNSIVTSVNEAIATLEGIAASFGLDDRIISDWVTTAQAELQSNSSQLISGAWAGAVAVGEVLIGVILVIVLTVYFVHSGDELTKWVRGLLPQRTRHAFQMAGDVSYGVMGRYVRGVALVGLIDAVGIGLVLVITLDLSLAMPLIILTFIGAFLPVIGAFMTGLISVLVGLVAEGWVVALIILGGTLAVQQLESHVLAPRVYGKALELPSAVVLLAISVGSIVGGIAGAFLATPVAAVLAALLRNRPVLVADTEAVAGTPSAEAVPKTDPGAPAALPTAPASSRGNGADRPAGSAAEPDRGNGGRSNGGRSGGE
ncbi:AI-2E family transporter [Actinorugispora endophytica]|uniref:AI-2E family transporter n=1 Tax=Actinorugispora endophytica TaxID=1605990 RepID=UPI001FB6098C|nr:AI-2E family transporter [Actinorugispora endophytica]